MTKELSNQSIIEVNKQCYDALGANYTDGPHDFELIQENSIWQQFIDNLPPSSKILNVGCGTGDISVWLASHNFEVTSTDLAPRMVQITSEKVPEGRNLVLGATELDQLGKEKFNGILAVHVIQHLNKDLLKIFFHQVHDLLSNDGKFLLVFTNTCYTESGYQLEGSKDGLYIAWYKHQLDDIAPLLTKAHLKPAQFWIQKSLENACGIKCPFAFICQKK